MELLRGRRRPWFLGFTACFLGLGFALLQEHGFDLEPCPLCILQRVAMLAAGVAFLATAVAGPVAWGRWFGSVLTLIGSGAGIAIAGRHVWLQSLPPDQVPACGPPLEQLMAVLPFSEAMAFVLRGEGSCAVIDAAWLGISLPGWTLLVFIALAIWSLFCIPLSVGPSSHK